MSKERYRVIPIPKQRRWALDAGRLGRGKHIVHGLAEVDVTEARQHMREHESRTGERLSFTAFIINCLGEAVDRNKELHAYRNWRGQLMIFEDVNVTTMIEVEMKGRQVPMPSHTLSVTVGGIAEKPGVVDGQIEVREYLHMTVSVDHDVVDGAPIARFGNELMGLIERGYGL